MKYLEILMLILVALMVSVKARIVRRQAAHCPEYCENEPLDFSFIVDSSASIWPQNFTIGLWFVADFVSQFHIGPDQVRVSMVTFGDRVYMEDAFSFNSYTNKVSLTQAIDQVPYRHGQATETGATIRWFMENHYPDTRFDVRHVLIVLTDGNSQEQEVTKEEAAKAQAAGLEIFAIGVGHEVLQEELHNIATDGEHVYVVNKYNALHDILDRLAHETCTGPHGGGILPPPQPLCQFSPVDISFVIDSSTSIGADNFTLQLEFIKEFLQVFDISPTATRIATVMFGEKVYEDSVINFDTYTNKKDTLDAILGLEWKHGTSTNTSAGINYMTDHFLPKFRSHAAHIGIVITDGKSQKREKTAAAAVRARENGITMLAVGVGKLGQNLSKDELETIAGSLSRVLTANDFSLLNTIRESLIALTCEGIQHELSLQL